MSIIQKTSMVTNLGLALMRQRSCVGRLLPDDYNQREIVTLNVTGKGISIGRRALSSNFLKSAGIFSARREKQDQLSAMLGENVVGVAKRLNDLGVTKIKIAGKLSRWQINYALKEFLNDPNIVKRDPYVARLRGFEISRENDILIIESLQREILEFESHLDGLTGIFDRKYFDKRFPLEVEEAQKLQKKLSLIIFDLDFFKKYNDSFGHSFGDEILRKIVETIKNKLREADIFGRIGGEEFAVIVKEAGIDNAARLASKLKKAVEEMSLEFTKPIADEKIEDAIKEKVKREGDSLIITVTISLGVSSLELNDSSRELFDRADKALYDAKNDRNSVSVY